MNYIVRLQRIIFTDLFSGNLIFVLFIWFYPMTVYSNQILEKKFAGFGCNRNLDIYGEAKHEVVLLPNIIDDVNYLSQDMFVVDVKEILNENTIFVIKYDFILKDDVTIPANCILQFEGGSISTNGVSRTIIGQQTTLIIEPGSFGKDIRLEGSFSNEYINLDWFCIEDNDDVTNLLNSLLKVGNVLLPSKTYTTSDIITINDDDRVLAGEDGSTIINKKTNLLNILANNIVIRNITFQGGGRGYPEEDASTFGGQYLINAGKYATNKQSPDYKEVSSITITKCAFEHATGGVYIYPGCSNIEIQKCVFDDMRFIPTSLDNPSEAGAGGYGVVCYFPSKHYKEGLFEYGVEKIKVEECVFKKGVVRHSLYLQFVKDGVFTNNKSYRVDGNNVTGYEYHCLVRSSLNTKFTNNYFQGGIGAITTDSGGKQNVGTIFANNIIEEIQVKRENAAAIRIASCDDCSFNSNIIKSTYKTNLITFSDINRNIELNNNEMVIGDGICKRLKGTAINDLHLLYTTSVSSLENICMNNNHIKASGTHAIYFRNVNLRNAPSCGLKKVTFKNNTIEWDGGIALLFEDINHLSGLDIRGNKFLSNRDAIGFINIKDSTEPIYFVNNKTMKKVNASIKNLVVR